MGLFQKDDNYWCTPVANKQLMLVYYDYYDYAHIYNSRFVNYDCKGFKGQLGNKDKTYFLVAISEGTHSPWKRKESVLLLFDELDQEIFIRRMDFIEGFNRVHSCSLHT